MDKHHFLILICLWGESSLNGGTNTWDLNYKNVKTY